MNSESGKDRRPPRKVRLPGFLIDHEIGLGTVVKRTTYAVGLKPCGGCERRAETLNRWMVFTPQIADSDRPMRNEKELLMERRDVLEDTSEQPPGANEGSVAVTSSR